MAAGGTPVRVGAHDFPDPGVSQAVPYGIYDVGANTGWVSVGADGDTAAFAVETLRRWCTNVGKPGYPGAKRLLVCAYETSLAITICHFPPGTSKWNRIEHRLFAHITMNWPGRPLTGHAVSIELNDATTTRAGLTVHAEADTNSYPRGIKVSPAEMAAIQLQLNPPHLPRRIELHHLPPNHKVVTNSTDLFSGGLLRQESPKMSTKNPRNDDALHLWFREGKPVAVQTAHFDRSLCRTMT